MSPPDSSGGGLPAQESRPTATASTNATTTGLDQSDTKADESPACAPHQALTYEQARALDDAYVRRGVQRRDEVRRLRLRDVDQRPVADPTGAASARAAWAHLAKAGLMSSTVTRVLAAGAP